MEKIIELIHTIMEEDNLIYGLFTGIRKSDDQSFQKVTVLPIQADHKTLLQFSYVFQSKVLHKNLDGLEAAAEMVQLIDIHCKQIYLYTEAADFHILTSKKGKVTILKRKPSKVKATDHSHNRAKNYIIPDGVPCPFLIRLGVMNEQGKVLKQKYDKFRQINKYLEIIKDCLPTLLHANAHSPLHVIDFGCGKSYLTFALYYYLVEIMQLDVFITGLDLKHDVITLCNTIAQQLHYHQLNFVHGDIKDYEKLEHVDMVITLHACDTATDEALIKAVEWGAGVILAVPCCQHELFDQIYNEKMQPMLKHGIIKEKMASLLTDCIRGSLLEIQGYTVQIMEFINMEHTPKNILIKAIKTGNTSSSSLAQYQELKAFWNVSPCLEKLLHIKN